MMATTYTVAGDEVTDIVAVAVPRPVEYRDIHGHPGYRVGRDGTVWSCWERFHPKGRVGTTMRLGKSWRQLRLKGGANMPYRQVSLRPGKQYRYVHRLVLEAFVGPCPVGLVCCHGDGNPTNNCLENLRWDTPEANERDKRSHGTLLQGEQIQFAKLTADVVRAIRARYAAGNVTQKQLAGIHGVSRSTIGFIVSRQTWKHIS